MPVHRRPHVSSSTFSIYRLPLHCSDVISDDFAAFHNETNMFQFSNIGDRSPATAIRSANLPGSIAPMRSCQPSISAALIVMARITSRGGIPASRNLITVAVLACPQTSRLRKAGCQRAHSHFMGPLLLRVLLIPPAQSGACASLIRELYGRHTLGSGS